MCYYHYLYVINKENTPVEIDIFTNSGMRWCINNFISYLSKFRIWIWKLWGMKEVPSIHLR